MPFCSETTTVFPPMQGMTEGMMPSVCVALTMRITTSITPMSAALSAVWKPVSRRVTPSSRNSSPSAAILSICAL